MAPVLVQVALFFGNERRQLSGKHLTVGPEKPLDFPILQTEVAVPLADQSFNRSSVKLSHRLVGQHVLALPILHENQIGIGIDDLTEKALVMGGRGLKGSGSGSMAALLDEGGNPEPKEEGQERHHPSRRRPVDGSKVVKGEHQRSSIPVSLAPPRQSQGPRQHARSVDSINENLRPILARSTTRASRPVAVAGFRDPAGLEQKCVAAGQGIGVFAPVAPR